MTDKHTPEQTAYLLMSAADWIAREIKHIERQTGQAQTRADDMVCAIRAQANRLLNQQSAPAAVEVTEDDISRACMAYAKAWVARHGGQGLEIDRECMLAALAAGREA